YNPSSSTAAMRTAQKPETPAYEPTDDSWHLRLSARAGATQDPSNYIGVSPQGTERFDIGLDLSEPPALTDGVQLYMTPSDGTSGRYVRDIRSSVSETQQWDVAVVPPGPNTEVTITWPDLGMTVPADVSLMLRDVDAGRNVFMRTSNGYTFRSGDSRQVRHLKIEASMTDDSALAVQSVTTNALRSGAVNLSFTLSRSATVEADIMNISGVPIATLGRTDAAGGVAQTLTWNGHNRHGARAPRGRYLARITATTPEGRAVQAVTSFNKIR
ncbi:MAG: hypothetical protein ACLFWB_12335, partial [Armatimonadota bacterium]